MPLGFFGTSNSSSKPQPLTADEVKRDKKDAERDCRGTVLKLQKTTVTIEKKLAEGGFAIVYLVVDKQSRPYALKRQFINDDQKQVEACKREYQIVSSLRGHKNIVCYADHLLYQNKTGIFDYMLLTAYYKTSVLQWMNDRLGVGKALSPNEVLSIFCDMCEAVARLHHSQTPVIHRDLKVENILIDERNRAAPPIFVLCDFGSASTKVLSSNTHPVHMIKEEIDRYTTLSYRSPEMIDIYEGKPIGTKSDTWALGVMLYKLCYFSLPFGESALAIQNASFSFPAQPIFPDEIKAIIKCLLDPEIERRPSIYQCSSLAFEAAGRPCPVNNVYSVHTPKLDHVVDKFKLGKHVHIGRTKVTKEPKGSPGTPGTPGKEDVTLISAESSGSTGRYPESATTSVNPRLRPKPINSISSVPVIPPSPQPLTKADHPQPEQAAKSAGPSDQLDKEPARKEKDHKHFGFTDLEDALPRERAQTEYFARNSTQAKAEEVESKDAPSTVSLPSAVAAQSHRRHTSDTSHIIKSAFKPYSQTINAQQASSSNDVNEIPGMAPTNQTGEADGSWNPFLAAPFGSQGAMDDNCFGEEFDGLPRTKPHGSNSNPDYDSDSVSIDSSDPFGAAPFDPSAVRVLRQTVLLVDEDGAGSVGSSEDLRKRMQEEDSEVDEQRMKARRRYSYEHIDGVGDEGSSDSRGRTEGESTDDMSRKEESSHDEDNDSSQQTDVASDDGGGRPLLEDDGLEEDEEDLIHNYLHNARFTQLTIDARRCTNPFLNQNITPKISPATNNHQKSDYDRSDAFFETRHDSFIEKPSLPPMPPPVDNTFAPATLPRQVTPLSAAPRHPGIYNTKPVVESAPPPVPVHSAPLVGALIPVAPIPPMKPPTATQMKPAKKVVASLPLTIPEPAKIILPESISESVVAESRPRLKTDSSLMVDAMEPKSKPRTGSMVEERENVHKTSTYSSKSVASDFIEGPKTPRSKKVGKEKKSYSRLGARSSGSDMETDGSEAEMCSSISSDKGALKQKRKKSTGFSLSRGSNVSVGPQPAIVTGAVGVKKNIEKRKMSSSKKSGGSNDAVNASFVNSSFQSEDIDQAHSRY